MKNITKIIIIIAIVLVASCNDELAIPVSADFTTNIVNNTLKYNQGFTVYLNNTSGEFISYFKGDKVSTTYIKDSLNYHGTSINVDLDSIVINGYKFDTVAMNDTVYKFTLYAATYDYEREELVSETKSVFLTVVK